MAPRKATTLLVLGLIVGAATAFAVSESLKVAKSPIGGTKVDKIFSPLCRCPKARARIAFRLRRIDRLTVSLLDSEGHDVRTLVHRRRFNRGRHHFTWNGRDDRGRLVPEGSYRPKVELGAADRTIVLPNPIRIDLTRPRVAVLDVSRRSISPDQDGYGDVVRIRYRASERAHGILLVNGRRRVRSLSRRPKGQLEWFGRSEGRALPPGTYRLAIEAEDLAGNVSRPVAAGTLRIRYVQLAERTLTAPAGLPIAVRVLADAPKVRWRLRHGSSVVARGTSRRRIVLRAPATPGRYVLTAEVAGHTARAVVRVRRAR